MATFGDCSENFSALTTQDLCDGFGKCGKGIPMTSRGFNSVVRYLQDSLASGVDVHISAYQGYDAVTNTLTVELTDGSTVDLDMTDLLADAVNATDNGDGTITLVVGGVSYCVAGCGGAAVAPSVIVPAIGSTTAIPAGTTIGQTLLVAVPGTAAYDQHATVTGAFFGNYRVTNTGAQAISAGAHGTNYVRAGESIVAQWDGTRWVSSHDYALVRGNGFRENEDGTYDLFMDGALLLFAENTIFGLTMPIAISNFGSNGINVQAALSARRAAGDVIGTLLPAASMEAFKIGLANITTANTPTQLALVWTRNVASTQAPQRYRIFISNAIRA